MAICSASACYNDNKEELYQNIQNTDEPCDTANVTYINTAQSILTENCATAGCHNSQTRQSGLNMSSYNDASTIASDGRLLGRITGDDGPIMPPTGSLPNCEIEKLKKWAADGAPEN